MGGEEELQGNCRQSDGPVGAASLMSRCSLMLVKELREGGAGCPTISEIPSRRGISLFRRKCQNHLVCTDAREV